MFKSKYKIFPAGTFIPTRARVFAILQLCLAFSILLWIASKPFMGDLFAVKSELLLYEAVLHQEPAFHALPLEQQNVLQHNYDMLQLQLQKPFLAKLHKSSDLVFFGTPPLLQAWLFFAILLSIFLLKRTEGALQACWILPLIALVYSADNQFYAKNAIDGDTHLFPAEQTIVDRYFVGQLPKSIVEQQKALQVGWNLYLIEHWAKEKPSKVAEERAMQLKKGEFAFNTERIMARQNDNVLASEQRAEKKPVILLWMFIAWNVLFAWGSQWKDKKPIP